MLLSRAAIRGLSKLKILFFLEGCDRERIRRPIPQEDRLAETKFPFFFLTTECVVTLNGNYWMLVPDDRGITYKYHIFSFPEQVRNGSTMYLFYIFFIQRKSLDLSHVSVASLMDSNIWLSSNALGSQSTTPDSFRTLMGKSSVQSAYTKVSECNILI